MLMFMDCLIRLMLKLFFVKWNVIYTVSIYNLSFSIFKLLIFITTKYWNIGYDIWPQLGHKRVKRRNIKVYIIHELGMSCKAGSSSLFVCNIREFDYRLLNMEYSQRVSYRLKKLMIRGQSTTNVFSQNFDQRFKRTPFRASSPQHLQRCNT